jgi:hypothetical protein
MNMPFFFSTLFPLIAMSLLFTKLVTCILEGSRPEGGCHEYAAGFC